jgi:hypothetical protein
MTKAATITQAQIERSVRAVEQATGKRVKRVVVDHLAGTVMVEPEDVATLAPVDPVSESDDWADD